MGNVTEAVVNIPSLWLDPKFRQLRNVRCTVTNYLRAFLPHAIQIVPTINASNETQSSRDFTQNSHNGRVLIRLSVCHDPIVSIESCSSKLISAILVSNKNNPGTTKKATSHGTDSGSRTITINSSDLTDS